MVFSFGSNRSGFGYGGTISANDMRNRRVIGNGSAHIIPGSGTISFGFAETGTWLPDNNSENHGTIYANNSVTVKNSGYNTGFIRITIYIRVSTNGRVNGRLVNINVAGTTRFAVDDYYDKDLGITDVHGPYDITANAGQSVQIQQVAGGINNVRMTATYYPSQSAGSSTNKKISFGSYTNL